MTSLVGRDGFGSLHRPAFASKSSDGIVRAGVRTESRCDYCFDLSSLRTLSAGRLCFGFVSRWSISLRAQAYSKACPRKGFWLAIMSPDFGREPGIAGGIGEVGPVVGEDGVIR